MLSKSFAPSLVHLYTVWLFPLLHCQSYLRQVSTLRTVYPVELGVRTTWMSSLRHYYAWII